MQPHSHYDMANTCYQELTLDSSTLSPNHNGHHLYPHFHHTPRYKQQCHHYQHSYQFSQQHPNHFQQPQYLGALNSHHPQQQPTTSLSFWKAFNTVLCDANEKEQEVNENFGELEAVYINARNKKETNVVENTCNVAKSNVGVPVSNECGILATETTAGGARRGRKKKKVEEEMVLMGSFFKRLVKRVVKHQEVLQNKLMEAIERMEKERAEWEEGWKLREREIQDREAIVKARERDLASRTDSSILSTLEKITAQNFVLVSASASGNTSHHQLSTIHET